MSFDHAKFRLALLAVSVSMALLCALSFWMRQFYDRDGAISAMVLCAAYAMFRAVQGCGRRRCGDALAKYGGTPMAASPYIGPYITAARAWAVLDSMWLAGGMCACLSCGIPGVFCILFHGLFFAGFRAARDVRPDLYDSDEKAQAMDAMEGILYTQACAAMAAACAFFINPS